MCACACVMLGYIRMSNREELVHHVVYKRSDSKLESRNNIITVKWRVQNSWCKLIHLVSNATRFQYSSFVNWTYLVFIVLFRALHLAQIGLTCSRRAGKQNVNKRENF